MLKFGDKNHMIELIKKISKESGIVFPDDERQVMHIRTEHFIKYSELLSEYLIQERLNGMELK
jgi:hypothetical protein